MHLFCLHCGLPQQKIKSWSFFLNHKEIFGHDSFKPNVIENPYSFITHMLLSMHVHFLIITYIHISCIVFRISISTCKCPHYSVHIYIYIYIYIERERERERVFM